MTVTNDFLPFATGVGANVASQADWLTLVARGTGFQAGEASSAQCNKAWRQASFIAAALAQLVADDAGLDMLDNGVVATAEDNIRQLLHPQGACANVYYGSAQTVINTTSTTYQNTGANISMVKKQSSNRVKYIGTAYMTSDTSASPYGALADLRLAWDTGGGPTELAAVRSGIRLGGTSVSLNNSFTPTVIGEDVGSLPQTYTAKLQFKSDAGDQVNLLTTALVGIEIWHI